MSCSENSIICIVFIHFPLLFHFWFSWPVLSTSKSYMKVHGLLLILSACLCVPHTVSIPNFKQWTTSNNHLIMEEVECDHPVEEMQVEGMCFQSFWAFWLLGLTCKTIIRLNPTYNHPLILRKVRKGLNFTVEFLFLTIRFYIFVKSDLPMLHPRLALLLFGFVNKCIPKVISLDAIVTTLKIYARIGDYCLRIHKLNPQTPKCKIDVSFP